jgi:hypothetical protein
MAAEATRNFQGIQKNHKYFVAIFRSEFQQQRVSINVLLVDFNVFAPPHERRFGDSAPGDPLAKTKINV